MIIAVHRNDDVVLGICMNNDFPASGRRQVLLFFTSRRA
jgi:hypothetical protein